MKPHLTERQHQTLEHIVAGLREKQIAHAMHVSPHTVNDYVRALFRKFEVRNKVQLAVAAVRGGLVP